MPRIPLFLRIGRTPATVALPWLLSLLPLTWLIQASYAVVLGPGLAEWESWLVAALICALLAASLVLHAVGHLAAARLLGLPRPERLPIGPLGDHAQCWPAAPATGREVLVSLAGPLTSGLLAAAIYLVWDRQFHAYLNLGLPLVVGLNALLACLNLVPGYPFDGGRLTRALVADWCASPQWATPLAYATGWLAAGVTVVWSVWLALQPARFGVETGGGLLIGVVSLALGLLHRPALATPAVPTAPGRLLLGWRVATVLLLALLALPALTFTPLLDGLLVPGTAVSVAPMIRVDPHHARELRGRFLLTSVITQTPIVAGQWIQAHFDPTVALVAPETIVPHDTTPRQAMVRSYAQLEDSVLYARVVAFRLAGHEVPLSGDGAVILSIMPTSPAAATLRPGDVVTELAGTPIRTTNDLIAAVRARPDTTPVAVVVRRGDERLSLVVPLIPGTRPADPPRLGVTIDTAHVRAELPFEATIEPERIVGGPSAGLMFTLTLYSVISGEDLTRGRPIAGTGTIRLDGAVGAIGGVRQKVAAAERAGASHFLVPRANADDARQATRHLEIVPVDSVEDAVAFLRGLPADAGR